MGIIVDQNIIVGTAIDTAFSAGAVASEAALGSLVVSPIGMRVFCRRYLC